MPKKHNNAVLFLQIMFILLSLPVFYAYFLFSRIIPSFANLILTLGIAALAAAVLLQVPEYEKTHRRQIDTCPEELNSAMVVRQTHEPTPQAKKLHDALEERGIHNELEYDDGYKHVDIHIHDARLNIEIDGKYHLLTSEHLFRDLERDSHSHRDGIDTIRVPNNVVNYELDELADSIVAVVRMRRESRTLSVFRQDYTSSKNRRRLY